MNSIYCAQSSADATVTNTTFVDGDEVKDPSLLPSELHGVCAGKRTTWLNQQAAEQDDDDVGMLFYSYNVQHKYFYLKRYIYTLTRLYIIHLLIYTLTCCHYYL
jgi:hypothetical protein